MARPLSLFFFKFGFILFCFECLRQELFFLSLRELDVWWLSLRCITAYNNSAERGSGDKDQDCFDTADDCLPPLIPPSHLLEQNSAEILVKKKGTDTEKGYSVCVCVCVQYFTGNTNIFFCRWIWLKFLCRNLYFPCPNTVCAHEIGPNTHIKAGSRQISFELMWHITSKVVSQNIPKIRAKLTT